MKITDEMLESAMSKAFDEWFKDNGYEEISQRKAFKAAFTLLMPVIERQAEALGFYGDPSNYKGFFINEIKLSDRGELPGTKIKVGGKFARQTQCEVEEMLGEWGGK